MNRFLLPFGLCIVLMVPLRLLGVVKYDEGRKTINGVQLLQDSEDPNAYYYIPQFPRLATREDGGFEFLCLKYVGQQGQSNGGLFHALVEFTLSSEDLNALQEALKKEAPGARIVGPVELMQTMEDGEEGMGSFEIVSAILSEGEGAMSQSLVSSGHAPLTPGSKAVVAALLNQEGATLLWNSLNGPTSDVSVSLHAYYEAAVKGYNAVVTAGMSTVYNHFSEIQNVQEGYNKDEIRDIVDRFMQDGDIKVEVFDRSAGLGINAGDMEKILQLVTDKLTGLMFDAKAGWAIKPEREVAVAKGQIKGRQSRGFFGKLFKGTGNRSYYTDSQYVLKNRSDVRTNTFRLDLSRSTTIKVPVHTSGNLGGLFADLNEDERYFRIVNLADPAFEKREVYFQVDGNYLGAFKDLVNFASVNFRKVYKGGADHEDINKSFIFNEGGIEDGKTLQALNFPRLGQSSADWINYEYQVSWSLKGDDKIIKVPADGNWVQADDPAIALAPPFEKKVIEIDADRALFQTNGVASAVVDFAVILNGQPRFITKAILRGTDAESTSKIALYHDKGEPVAYRVTWYANGGNVSRPLEELPSGYLFLIPPSKEEIDANGE